jgi:hypothetical protein
MSRLVSRNPFARCELYASRVHDVTSTCHYCGGIRVTVRSGTKWLYQFWEKTDGGRTYLDEQMFCSRECRTDYYYPHEKSDGF